MVRIDAMDQSPEHNISNAAREARWCAYQVGLEPLVETFEPITLAEMRNTALLNRTDVKYVMSLNQLREALVGLQGDYRILSVGGQRFNRYRTLYFDTPEFDLYKMHVNKRADRYKVRCREYVDSRRSFLEVKHKTHKGRTIKERIDTDQPALCFDLAMKHWLQDVFPYDCQSLQPMLWNTFTRITLVCKRCCERVTLDFDLAFYTDSRSARLEGIAVVEVKQNRAGVDSPFMAHMRYQHILPQGFSKYCIGVSLNYDRVKKNALKQQMRMIQKISKGVVINERFSQVLA
jgi:hypothetical protein